ncbi:hypothetical protein K438DRAFT_1789441 [Mycena galopus ATCC 62051]|nr:hypothetical protein K438DRAFT_1789441 [Mycena galopus ATCC 62051]
MSSSSGTSSIISNIGRAVSSRAALSHVLIGSKRSNRDSPRIDLIYIFDTAAGFGVGPSGADLLQLSYESAALQICCGSTMPAVLGTQWIRWLVSQLRICCSFATSLLQIWCWGLSYGSAAVLVPQLWICCSLATSLLQWTLSGEFIHQIYILSDAAGFGAGALAMDLLGLNYESTAVGAWWGFGAGASAMNMLQLSHESAPIYIFDAAVEFGVDAAVVDLLYLSDTAELR